MRTFEFEKDPDERWYVVLPSYLQEGGVRADLEMVAGADDMLDQLSEYKNRVKLEIWSTGVPMGSHYNYNYLDAYNILTKIDFNDMGAGAYYKTDGSLNVDKIWLCPVLHYVFNEYPEKIYYKVIK